MVLEHSATVVGELPITVVDAPTTVEIHPPMVETYLLMKDLFRFAVEAVCFGDEPSAPRGEDHLFVKETVAFAEETVSFSLF